METILEELEVINSIYEDAVTFSQQTSTVLIEIPDTSVHVKLWLPGNYPEGAPRVSNISGIHTDSEAIERVQQIIRNTFVPGEVYLFTFIDEVKSEAEHLQQEQAQEDEAREAANFRIQSAESQKSSGGSERIAEWATSDDIRDRGSVFTGRAIKADSFEEAENLVVDLLNDKRLSQATHNMVAWRIALNEEGTQIAQDFDNDGEAGAGTSMLHVLDMADVRNVVVVVTRFYGGTHLGGDRFRHIKNCTRNALTAGGFINK